MRLSRLALHIEHIKAVIVASALHKFCDSSTWLCFYSGNHAQLAHGHVSSILSAEWARLCRRVFLQFRKYRLLFKMPANHRARHNHHTGASQNKEPPNWLVSNWIVLNRFYSRPTWVPSLDASATSIDKILPQMQAKDLSCAMALSRSRKSFGQTRGLPHFQGAQCN